MSKKNSKSSVKKASKPAKKAVSKSAKSPKKTVKKVNKPVKSKAVAKKVAKKLTKSKPAQKKVIKKVSPKKSVSKTKSAKAVANKKVVVKKAAKPVKKTAPKKLVKPVKKLAVKKTITTKAKVVSKPVVKAKPATKPVAKKVEVKSKPIASKPEPKAPVKSIEKQVSVQKLAPKTTAVTQPKAEVIKVANEKPQNEPSGKFELEYVIHSSTSILFEFLTSPSGLSEWFCDDVNIRNENYTFFWDGAEQNAKLVKFIEEKLVRFQWSDKNDGSYFEFRIERDDLTNDISLIVTDFADTKEERESSKLLWDSQIDKLLHVLGSYF